MINDISLVFGNRVQNVVINLLPSEPAVIAGHCTGNNFVHELKFLGS